MPENNYGVFEGLWFWLVYIQNRDYYINQNESDFWSVCQTNGSLTVIRLHPASPSFSLGRRNQFVAQESTGPPGDQVVQNQVWLLKNFVQWTSSASHKKSSFQSLVSQTMAGNPWVAGTTRLVKKALHGFTLPSPQYLPVCPALP